jgi:hypothetical protein
MNEVGVRGSASLPKALSLLGFFSVAGGSFCVPFPPQRSASYCRNPLRTGIAVISFIEKFPVRLPISFSDLSNCTAFRLGGRLEFAEPHHGSTHGIRTAKSKKIFVYCLEASVAVVVNSIGSGGGRGKWRERKKIGGR